MKEEVLEIKHYGYDFMEENKLLFLIEGHSNYRGIFYILYICCIYCFNSFLVVMAAYGSYLVAPNKELIIGALHVCFNSIFALWGLSTRLIVWKSVAKARQYILDGFYEYHGEDEDPEVMMIKKQVVPEIKKRNDQLLYLFLITCLSNTIFFPTSQYFLVSQEDYEKNVDTANPYLPNFFHLPFSTRTFLGFSFAFLLNILLLLYIYGMAIAMKRIYVSTLVQCKFQLKILNHSIRNVHRRAFLVYVKKYGLRAEDLSQEDLYESKEYQKCLIECLRSNILHHQTLLRFHIDCQTYNGSIVLLVSLIAAIIFASLLYLIMKNPPLNFLINYVISIITEQFYAFYTCYFGELVLQESKATFTSLYDVGWYNCNKEFNRLLSIFMCFTMKPIRVKSLLLDMNASLETFGDVISTMYKIMNVFRQSDKN